MASTVQCFLCCYHVAPLSTVYSRSVLTLLWSRYVSGMPRRLLRVLEHPLSSGTTASLVAQ